MGGSSESVIQEFGDKTKADYEMHIQYCGGWGYLKHASAVRAEVDKMHNGAFYYTFMKDAGRTNNLEINIRKKEADESSGYLVHGKTKNN